jgi:hypothetical protein
MPQTDIESLNHRIRIKTMTDKFYELSHNYDRFGDSGREYDGYLEKFDGWNKINDAFLDCSVISLGGDKGIAAPETTKDNDWRIVNAQMPKEVNFVVTRKWLSSTDFPHIDHAFFWPIMSTRMVEVLLSVGDFPHQIIPVTFRDRRGKILEPNYVILQLNQISDLIDRNESVYTLKQAVVDPSRSFICDIKKLRLVEPEKGFPPIFRVKWNVSYLYVSAAAKKALEAADIQGLDFSRIT